MTWMKVTIGTVLGLVIVLNVLYFFVRRKKPHWLCPEEKNKSTAAEEYDKALITIGVILVTLGVLMFAALAGLSANNNLEEILHDKSKDVSIGDTSDGVNDIKARDLVLHGDQRSGGNDNRIITPLRILLLLGFTILGNLFFIAGTLRRKRNELVQTQCQKTQPNLSFSRCRLWGGTLYRLGEAILFSIVLFLAMESGMIDIREEQSIFLLLVGLLMAMFVKPAEQLINGVSLRLFDAVDGLVSTKMAKYTPKDDDSPVVLPRNNDETSSSTEGTAGESK